MSDATRPADRMPWRCGAPREQAAGRMNQGHRARPSTATPVSSAEVEPRTHLADFLRETLNLTGTHLGCEHGVCGACTVLVDGVPARSCITYAVACEGAEVSTIEGLDDDEITARAARGVHARACAAMRLLHAGHAGSARDIVLRLPDADERDIRVAMTGNLCRCTGYVGIVRAIAE